MELNTQNFSYNLFDNQQGISDRLFSKAKYYSVIKATDRTLSETVPKRFPENIINDTQAKKKFIASLVNKTQKQYDSNLKKARERYLKSDRYKNALKRKKKKERELQQRLERQARKEMARQILEEYPSPKYQYPKHKEWSFRDRYTATHGYLKPHLFVFHQVSMRYEDNYFITKASLRNDTLDEILDQVEYHFEKLIDKIWEYADGTQRYIFKMVTPWYGLDGDMVYDKDGKSEIGFSIERSPYMETKEQMMEWVQETTQAFADKVSVYLRKNLQRVEISELMIEEVVIGEEFYE